MVNIAAFLRTEQIMRRGRDYSQSIAHLPLVQTHKRQVDAIAERLRKNPSERTRCRGPLSVSDVFRFSRGEDTGGKS